MRAQPWIAALLILGTLSMLALNLPGQMSPDSVAQLLDGRTGAFNSWHPPVMAWLLGLGDAVWPGPALFVIFDAMLLTGAWLALLQLAPHPRWPAFVAALAMLLTPQFLLHQGTVWKDLLFADSAIAGFAALAVAAKRSPPSLSLLALCGSLLVLAALARQNGLVLLPVAAVALGWIAARKLGARAGLAYGLGFLAGVALLLGAANWGLSLRSDGGAGTRAEIQRAQIYDLIGALKAAPGLALPLVGRRQPELARLMRQDGVRLYSPAMNDTLEQSAPLLKAIDATPQALIFTQWKELILAHPGLYLAQRWPVFLWTVTTPDSALCHPVFAGVDGDPAMLKALGLSARVRPQDAALAAYARAWIHTPVLSHLAFALLAVILLAALLLRHNPPDIAVAFLLVGALLFALSFFFISIACDYRYLDFLDLASLSAGFYWAATRPYKN
jgi:hypothetical protein